MSVTVKMRVENGCGKEERIGSGDAGVTFEVEMEVGRSLWGKGK